MRKVPRKMRVQNEKKVYHFPKRVRDLSIYLECF
jgi:hypothetical protein